MVADTKLTLKLNGDSILKAKRYAARKGISLSKLVENFFDGISSEGEREKLPATSYSSLVQELAGIISLPKDCDCKADYGEYLRQKYE